MGNQQLKNIGFSAVILFFLLTPHPAISGDIEAGRIKAAVCNHCHQDNSDTSIPKIAGQHEKYLVEQMLAYRNGLRKDEIMETVARRLKSEQDLYDLAAYFASLPAVARLQTGSQNSLGHDVFKNKIRCDQCHGAQGKGDPNSQPIVPLIAGQNKDYIVKRLMEFQMQSTHRGGVNPMPKVAKQLDIVDVFSVSEYISNMH